MCAVHIIPYLSHKMVKIMFLSEYLLKFSCTNNINNVSDLIMVCYSSCQPFPSIQLLSKIFIDSDFYHNYLRTLYLFECLL